MKNENGDQWRNVPFTRYRFRSSASGRRAYAGMDRFDVARRDLKEVRKLDAEKNRLEQGIRQAVSEE